MKFILLLISICVSVLSAQDQNDIITVIGDSLVGKTIEGEMIREVYGNVVLTQGNVVITCDKAVQFIARNDAELIGNVIARQDSLTIRTPQGFYFGNLRKSFSNSGVILDDTKVILSADTGEYYFDLDKAFFTGNVRLYDTATTLTSEKLTYFKNQNKAVATGNVSIIDSSNVINADSLVHFRDNRVTLAFNNVKIRNLESNTVIFGEHLEDYADENYSVMDLEPLLIQVDTTYTTRIDSLNPDSVVQSYDLDSLIIRSEIMKAFRDTTDYFEAIDSVRILRGEFSSVNDHTIYFRSLEKIVTVRKDETGSTPVLWYENSQLTGDSVAIFLEDNRIKMLNVFGNAFLLSQNKIYPERFDQSRGDSIKLTFRNEELIKAEFFGNVLSIYYLYEDDLPNGLTKSSARNAVIEFEENEVAAVKLYGLPASEYYPEIKVKGKERAFTLPAFIHYTNRPKREELLNPDSTENKTLSEQEE
ncbi:MAG: hypothetical protein Kow0098_17940 [Ignavibacteriaceae bacterium]